MQRPIEDVEVLLLAELKRSIKNVVARAEETIPADVKEVAAWKFTADEADLITLSYNNLLSKMSGRRPQMLTFDQLMFHRSPMKSRTYPVCKRHTMQYILDTFKGNFYPYFMSTETNEEKYGQLPTTAYIPVTRELRIIMTAFLRSYTYHASIVVCEIRALANDNGTFECIHREFVNLSCYREFRGMVLSNIKQIQNNCLHGIDCMHCLPLCGLFVLNHKTDFDYDSTDTHELSSNIRCIHSEYAKRESCHDIISAYMWYFSAIDNPRECISAIMYFYCEKENPLRRVDVVLGIEDIIVKSYKTFADQMRLPSGKECTLPLAKRAQDTIKTTLETKRRLYFAPTEMVIERIDLLIL